MMRCIACETRLDRSCIWAVKDGLTLLRCPACGLGVRETLPGPGDLPEIYGQGYFDAGVDRVSDGYADYIADQPLHRSLARRRLRLIGAVGTSTRGQLLDVGAAAGFFVDEAERAGWRARGVDVAESMVDWGRASLGVPLAVGTIQDVEDDTFAAVTMWDYLEHSLDPLADLECARRLLHPDGIVALSTGDLDSLFARVSGVRWHLLTPRHHNYYFSPRSLRMLLERAGFEVISSAHPGACYSLAHLAYKLDRLMRRDASAWVARRIGASRLGRLSVPVNLFDIATVVARPRSRPA